MANIKLTIQHGDSLIEPPIQGDIQIEWERTGSPGKLTFTTVDDPNSTVVFYEGDAVRFYYNEKLIFLGFVFKKKCDRERSIEVTCYDQIRYLKNKYTYMFENKTATQIVKALCADFNLQTGTMDNTNYVIPAVAKENTAALDIVLDVLEETLTNTGEMYVFYDNAGKLAIQNCKNMMSTTLIMEETAENFDYTSSIDDETYNSIILYYKDGEDNIVLYTAQSPSTINQWGTLRYFEEVKNHAIGQSKANSLLQLYNRKTRELKVTGAFGDVSVRGGTLIPVRLHLGDIAANNYMVVEKATHTFNADSHTMDLTLQGAWEDKAKDIVSKTIGSIKPTVVPESAATKDDGVKTYRCTINCSGSSKYAGDITVIYTLDGVGKQQKFKQMTKSQWVNCDKNSKVTVVATGRIMNNGKTGSVVFYDTSTDGFTEKVNPQYSFSTIVYDKITQDVTLDFGWMSNEDATKLYALDIFTINIDTSKVSGSADIGLIAVHYFDENNKERNIKLSDTGTSFQVYGGTGVGITVTCREVDGNYKWSQTGDGWETANRPSALGMHIYYNKIGSNKIGKQDKPSCTITWL